MRVEAALVDAGIKGWIKHPRHVVGRPDFWFGHSRTALFVDGCFWHACPRCGRLPKTNVDFWREKIDANRRRDQRVRRALRGQGNHVLRVWEHELADEKWLARVTRFLRKAGEAG